LEILGTIAISQDGLKADFVAEESTKEVEAIHDVDDVVTIDKLIFHVVGTRTLDLVIVVTVLDKFGELYKDGGV